MSVSEKAANEPLRMPLVRALLHLAVFGWLHVLFLKLLLTGQKLGLEARRGETGLFVRKLGVQF